MSVLKVSTFRERLSESVNTCSKSQSAIASELGIAKQTLSAWLTGQNSPRTPMVNVLADYFDVSPAWLLGFDVPKYEDKQKSKAWAEYIHSKQSSLHELTEPEQQLLTTYRALPDPGREYLLQQARIAQITFGEKSSSVSDNNAV